MFTKSYRCRGCRDPTRAIAAALCLGILVLTGCHAYPAENAKGADTAQPARRQETETRRKGGCGGVTLTAEQVEKMGIATEPAKPMDYAAEIAGYGVVIPHDTIATAVAELTSAQAAGAQSRAAAARAQRLAGTPGAMSADAVESAARQIGTDGAALALAQRRLSSVIGADCPTGWQPGRSCRNWPVASSSCCA